MTESVLAAVIGAAVGSGAPAPVDAAVSAPPAAVVPAPPDAVALSAARAEGEAAGRAAERVRARTILSAPEANGRETLAAHLAFATDMDAAAAVDLLKASPVVQSQSGRLDALVPDPQLGTGVPPQSPAASAEAGLAAAVDRLVRR